MKLFEKKFAEFKSIFVSKNLLKENEEHANIVTSSTMFNLFWMAVITWILVSFNVFKIGTSIATTVLIFSFILLFIPALVCYLKKGKGKWIKYLLFISFTILLAIADALLKYNVTLIMVLPTILAARYYNKKFTLGIAIFTSLLFIVSAFISVKIGQQDLNTYNLIIPSGTIIRIDSTLRDAVTNLNIDESERLTNIFIHFFLPKMLVFNIIAFACVQISQSGKKMIQRQEEITKEGERIETELSLASAIQKNMLPSGFVSHDEVDIYATMVPAKEVGGDFYDMFFIDDDHLAICVADVSGKGIPASLVMMISKILIKNVSKIDADVSLAFNRVNNMLCDGNNSSIFVTSWFGIIDLRNGKMEFVNAGHNPPLLFSSKTGEFEYLRTKPNLVLAGMADVSYLKNEIQLEPGDRLFLYTDGVTEATNLKNELYGEIRLKEFLNNHLKFNSKETINAIKKDLDKFANGALQFDDITMLELILLKNKGGSYITEKEFKADKKELSSVQDFIKKELLKNNCNRELIKKIDLAIEEVFVNIASYAFQEKKGTVNVKIGFNKNTFEFVFEDDGIKFNPLEKSNPDVSLDAGKRKIGGLGIYMTKELMDSVKYKYENNKNILIMKKRIR